MLRTFANLRTISIATLLMLLTGCATHDAVVARQTADRIKYFTTPAGEQYVREMIHFHGDRWARGGR